MARDFANDITASFRNRLAEDFMAGRRYELDDYVKMGKMGELQSLRQILWERNGGLRGLDGLVSGWVLVMERLRWWTGMGSRGEGWKGFSWATTRLL